MLRLVGGARLVWTDVAQLASPSAQPIARCFLCQGSETPIAGDPLDEPQIGEAVESTRFEAGDQQLFCGSFFHHSSVADISRLAGDDPVKCHAAPGSRAPLCGPVQTRVRVSDPVPR